VNESLGVPTILGPADQSQVNQSAPITLAWTVQGLVSSFDLQLSTNADFSHPVVDTNGLGSMSYVQSNLLANAQYYWRVRTVNEGGAASDWA